MSNCNTQTSDSIVLPFSHKLALRVSGILAQIPGHLGAYRYLIHMVSQDKYWVIFDLGFPNDSVVKNLHANAGDTGDVSLILGWGRATGKGKTTHCSILAWEMPLSMKRGAW